MYGKQIVNNIGLHLVENNYSESCDDGKGSNHCTQVTDMNDREGRCQECGSFRNDHQHQCGPEGDCGERGRSPAYTEFLKRSEETNRPNGFRNKTIYEEYIERLIKKEIAIQNPAVPSTGTQQLSSAAEGADLADAKNIALQVGTKGPKSMYLTTT